MYEWTHSLEVQLMTGEEELPTEEEMDAKEDEADWAYDNYINN